MAWGEFCLACDGIRKRTSGLVVKGAAPERIKEDRVGRVPDTCFGPRSYGWSRMETAPATGHHAATRLCFFISLLPVSPLLSDGNTLEDF